MRPKEIDDEVSVAGAEANCLEQRFTSGREGGEKKNRSGGDFFFPQGLEWNGVGWPVDFVAY